MADSKDAHPEIFRGGLQSGSGGLWWWSGFSRGRVRAGMTSRQASPEAILATASPVGIAEAEQVHGASSALIGPLRDRTVRIAGCDALLTRVPGVALLARTADCLPLFVFDPIRWAVGLAHAGWRGLAAELPIRFISCFRRAFHSRPRDLRIAIGPAIRACCYEVGPEVADCFRPFVQPRHGRVMCDLIAVAMRQFRQSGIRVDQVVDSRRCTSCESSYWFSLRKDGPMVERLTSLIMLRPERA